jgi:cell division protein FtsN
MRTGQMMRREKAIGRRGIEVVGAVFVTVVIGVVIGVVVGGFSEIEVGVEVEIEVDEGEVEFDIVLL